MVSGVYLTDIGLPVPAAHFQKAQYGPVQYGNVHFAVIPAQVETTDEPVPGLFVLSLIKEAQPQPVMDVKRIVCALQTPEKLIPSLTVLQRFHGVESKTTVSRVTVRGGFDHFAANFGRLAMALLKAQPCSQSEQVVDRRGVKSGFAGEGSLLVIGYDDILPEQLFFKAGGNGTEQRTVRIVGHGYTP